MHVYVSACISAYIMYVCSKTRMSRPSCGLRKINEEDTGDRKKWKRRIRVADPSLGKE